MLGILEPLDNSVENLVSIVLRKLNAGKSPVIFGTDYPTKDGTCVRDYVDVRDIARTLSGGRCHLSSSVRTQHWHRTWRVSARDHQTSLGRHQSHRKPTSHRRPSLPLHRHQLCKVGDGLYIQILTRRERKESFLTVLKI